MSGSSLTWPSVGGISLCFIDNTTAIASIAPAAPSAWPVTPLVEVTMGRRSPNTSAMAAASAASLSGVDVPCAFT